MKTPTGVIRVRQYKKKMKMDKTKHRRKAKIEQNEPTKFRR
jgi:hypothetical protein